ncbi:MAG: HD domain-containing phosphohydrolase [Planctomycetota bacterium]
MRLSETHPKTGPAPRLAWSFRPGTRRALFVGILLAQAAVLLSGVLLIDFWLRREMHLAPIWADRLMGFQLSVSLCVFVLTGTVLVLAGRRYRDSVEHRNAVLNTEVERGVRNGLARRDAMIFGLAKLADYRDTDTGAHLERIGRYAGLLAEALQSANPDAYPEIDDAWIERLCLASSLHDIGKVGIPDRILLKPGRLTEDERAIMQTHALIGADTLIAIRRKLGADPFVDMGIEVAMQHHEKWDGSGYPFGISGPSISLAARIVAMADFYDAVTSERVYKAAMSHREANNLILSQRGSHFDPAVVDAYVLCAAEFDRIRSESSPDTETHPPEELVQTAMRYMANAKINTAVPAAVRAA